MIKAVLFDFGGVLTESGKSGFTGAVMAELYGVGIDELDIGKDHALMRRGREDDGELFERLNKRYGKQVAKQMFVDRAQASFKPSQGVYDLAARLRAHGIKTGLLSNIFAMNANRLRAEGWYDGFSPIILSCEEGYAKPDPEIYEIAVKKTGTRPEEILFVDDQAKCIGPAQKLGFKIVVAKTPDQIVADVKSLIMAENGIEL
ncbi:MAG TPA: HAD family phosphatase [Candidatus Saccharimonadales bacterium]|nr:HAD family phosphatase [Candidatus Saccharimonadales bacterium]